MTTIGDLFNTNWLVVFRCLLPSERRQLATTEYYIAFRLTRVLADHFVLIPLYILPSYPAGLPYVAEPEPEPNPFPQRN